MQFIETHCHLDFDDYAKDLPEVIERSQENGIAHFINIGIDGKSSEQSIRLAQQYPSFSAAVGWHPHDAQAFDAAWLNRLIGQEKVVAVGEIGLDFYRNHAPEEVQRRVFVEQLHCAKQAHLPIVIHSRSAERETLDILLEEGFHNYPVVLHCFGGTAKEAQLFLRYGMYLSFNGRMTFKNSTTVDVIRNVPLEQIFLETDSPFLTPMPYRGKRNSPEYIPLIAQKLAEIKKVNVEKVAEVTTRNACHFFGISLDS